MSYNPDVIDPAEEISRFAFESGYYRSDGHAKAKAFEPDRDNEVSMFRIDGLDLPSLWALGDQAGSGRGKRARASISMNARNVDEVGLQLVIDEPPTRHAAIRGWTKDEALRMRAQQLLAAAARVRIRD